VQFWTDRKAEEKSSDPVGHELPVARKDVEKERKQNILQRKLLDM